MQNTKRAIYVPGKDAWYSLGAYVRAVKKAKANPDAMFSCTICSWASGRGRDIMREFMDGVMDRINQGIPYTKRGKREYILRQVQKAKRGD